MSEKSIVSILMERDGMSREDAKRHLKYVRELINDAISSGDFYEIEEIMYSELGLEMDYVFELV